MTALTGAQFCTLIRARCGNRSSTDLPDATINLEAEMLRQNKLERLGWYPWFLQYEDTSLACVVNQEYVSLPTGWLGFDPNGDDDWSGLAYNNPNISGSPSDPWIQLLHDDFEIKRQGYQNLIVGDPLDPLATLNQSMSLAGPPAVFGIFNGRAYMRAIPDKTYSLRFRFYKSDAVFPTDTSTNLWLTNAADWVIGEVGFILASQYLRDADSTQTFDMMRKEGRDRCYRETTARNENGKPRQQGDD